MIVVDFRLFIIHNQSKIRGKIMNHELLYLDTYVVQQDMRIRLPKIIIKNFQIVKGLSQFDIYMDKENNELIFKLNKKDKGRECDL